MADDPVTSETRTSQSVASFRHYANTLHDKTCNVTWMKKGLDKGLVKWPKVLHWVTCHYIKLPFASGMTGVHGDQAPIMFTITTQYNAVTWTKMGLDEGLAKWLKVLHRVTCHYIKLPFASGMIGVHGDQALITFSVPTQYNNTVPWPLRQAFVKAYLCPWYSVVASLRQGLFLSMVQCCCTVLVHWMWSEPGHHAPQSYHLVKWPKVRHWVTCHYIKLLFASGMTGVHGDQALITFSITAQYNNTVTRTKTGLDEGSAKWPKVLHWVTWHYIKQPFASGMIGVHGDQALITIKITTQSTTTVHSSSTSKQALPAHRIP